MYGLRSSVAPTEKNASEKERNIFQKRLSKTLYMAVKKKPLGTTGFGLFFPFTIGFFGLPGLFDPKKRKNHP